MAQGIDVPGVQNQVVPYQAPNPLPFVSQALDRQQQGNQFAIKQASDLADTFNLYHQQRIQNQLNALKAYSDIAGTSGITAANQMAPNIPGGMNTQNLPTDPFSQFQDPNAPPTPPAQQASAPPPPTAGTPDASGAPIIAPQDTQPSHAIALSAAAGHPINPGLAAFHAPVAGQDPTQALMNQMAINSSRIQRASTVGGSFAQDLSKKATEANAGLAAQLAAQKSANDIAMQPNQAAKLQNDVAMLPVANAKANQDLANSKAEIPMKIATQQAEVAKTVAPKMAEIKNLQSTFDKIKQINSSPTNNSIPFTGDLGAKYATQNPNTKSPWAQNQYNAEQTAGVGAGIIEKLAEGRYNHEQAQVIAKSFFPTGNQLGTPQAKDKLDRFQNYINQMRSGQIDQANAQLDAIAGGGFNPQSLGNPAPFPGSQNPQIHNAALEWAQANPKDPRAKAVLAKAQASLGNQ